MGEAPRRPSGHNRQVFLHVSIALSRYVKELGRDGRHPPPELIALAELFADSAQRRPEGTNSAGKSSLAEPEGMRTDLMLNRLETASELRCSPRTVDRLISSGKLVGVKVEGATRVRRADLDEYVAGLSRRPLREQVIEKGGTAC